MRLLSEVLADWMSRRVAPATPASSANAMFGTGTVIALMSGGLYLVETDKGAWWMQSTSDESMDVNDSVWVGYANDAPFVLGKRA